MTIKSNVDLKAAFARRDFTAPAAAAPEVPERIRRDALEPKLRPGGSMRAMADAVDQAVRETQDAEEARRKMKRRGKAAGMGF